MATTTVVLLLWRWAFQPALGEGTGIPWTVLGLVLVVATAWTDRVTRPFAGTATSAAAAGLASVLSGSAGDLGAWVVLDLLHVVSAAAVIAAPASALHLLFSGLPRARRRWAAVVVFLGSSAWVAWMSWWPLDEDSPSASNRLTAGAAATLLLAVVLGELTVRRWFGAVFALCPAVLLAAGPLVASDPLGVIALFVVSAYGAAGCVAAVGVVALARAVRRRLSPAPR
ncbi:hypothetical protein [Kineococcus glutinatus]|uniref:Uncharacterized protein n=1 Tax=Kineococcus glutinatus TaxID=1070872 RepID=A0ABP9HQD2_9ACTN